MSERIVIVGAGHAGGSAVGLLKQFGYHGEIVVIGDEPVGPYQRPPLSKAYLKGLVDTEFLKLKPDSFYVHDRITMRLGETVAALDPAARTVTLGSGEALAYDKLILATGSRARKLAVPGTDLVGVLELRSVADADALRSTLLRARRLAIIGGGYIGLEAAATARAHGIEVVVVEREARVLARVASAPLSAFFESYHRANDVEIIHNAEVAAILGEAGAVSAIQLADGRTFAADAVLVGVGAVACDGLARSAGLACENGIVVDAESRTSDPSIYAIGDVAWRPVPHYSRMFRIESVGNALEQAKQTVCSILGRPVPNVEVPWFWSDQYELKLQIAGLAFDADQTVIRGSTADAKFAVFHLSGSRVLAVEAVNSAAEFVVGKRMIGERTPIQIDRLVDATIPMSKVTSQAA